MRSNVCKIEKGTKDLEAIFRESEKVAAYNDLNHKQTLQLRLLCEELDGMLPNIIDDFDGELWFEFEDGVCKVNVSFKIEEFSTEKKEQLISLSKDKKNSAAFGIVGKIRSAIEDYILDENNLQNIAASVGECYYVTGSNVGEHPSFLWNLEQYRKSVVKEKKEAWDELEKSVIASVADDVTVSIKGKSANIVVIKKFA